MALVGCSECAAKISDKAQACPHCGNPVRGTVTTQQTSKIYKLASLIGSVLIIFGLVSCSASSNPGSAIWLLLVGGLVFFYGRVGAWWNNG